MDDVGSWYDRVIDVCSWALDAGKLRSVESLSSARRWMLVS